MKVDGRCYCGAITYEAEVDPATLSLCHCSDCQATTGTAFRANILSAAEHFTLKSGAPTTFIKTAESGNKRMQAFCGTCGTQLWSCAPENTPSYMLRAGTLAQRAAFTPSRQSWRRSAMPWVDAIATVPANQKG